MLLPSLFSPTHSWKSSLYSLCTVTFPACDWLPVCWFLWGWMGYCKESFTRRAVETVPGCRTSPGHGVPLSWAEVKKKRSKKGNIGLEGFRKEAGRPAGRFLRRRASFSATRPSRGVGSRGPHAPAKEVPRVPVRHWALCEGLRGRPAVCPLP